MIVVADTTPLNYLILIDGIDLLPALYETILIPTQVLQELQRPKAPQPVRAWASQLPPWCSVERVTSPPDAALQQLDSGECEAIQLSIQSGINLLLMDDAEGRREAIRRHLKVTGTVSVLETAAQRDLVVFREALSKLDRTTFRLSPSLRREFLQRNP
jgi:predicted nucleic acid-binding protein